MSARVIATLLVGAALVWFASWFGNAARDIGDGSFLGLGEGDWRTFLDPGLALALVGLFALSRSLARVVARRALVIAGIGVGLMLAGNILEWGLNGGASWHSDAGWIVLLVGSLITMVALAVAGISTVRGPGRRRAGWPIVAATCLSVVGAIAIIPQVQFVAFGLALVAWGIGFARIADA